MKRLNIALATGALALLSVAAHGQAQQQPPYTLGHWFDLDVNQIIDPGFEKSPYSQYWDDSASYIDTPDGDKIQLNLGELTTSSHTGNKAFDMEIYGGSYNQLKVNVLHQDLVNLTKGDIITKGSVYVQAGVQNISLTIGYTDGTFSRQSRTFYDYDAPHGANGWQLWDFTSIIKKTKTIKYIEFVADSGGGTGIRLDDVSLIAHYHIFIPD